MTCCTPGAHSFLEADASTIESDDAALLALSRKLGDGTRQLEFAVPDAHCAACIQSIEMSLSALPQVVAARVNLTRRRVRIVLDPSKGRPSELAEAIRQSGYHTHVLDPAQEADGDPVLAELVKALAVAGFAAGNIMLFSVSVWSGANEATRDSSTGSRRSSPCRLWPMPAASSSVQHGGRCGSARPTWTCRSALASSSPQRSAWSRPCNRESTRISTPRRRCCFFF